MRYGFITGLPRSGSAWIANYLSYGSCMMLHDAWKLGTPEEIKVRIDRSAVLMGGVSDCSNVMFHEQIIKTFPDAKWVVITRPVEEVKASCEAINFPFQDFTINLKSLLSKVDVLKVPFAKLFTDADRIGKFLYEDWTCPSWRKAQLKDLNVQLHWGRVSEQFRVPDNISEAQGLTPTKLKYYDLIKEITDNNLHAMRFLHQARGASELYRRLKEGKPIDTKVALEMLEAMATEWLISPFVKNFSASLAPAIMSCLEKYQNQPDLEHCPIDVDLLTTVTYIFKGNDGVKEFMPRVRQLSDQILAEKS